jgi:hypothetical protein
MGPKILNTAKLNASTNNVGLAFCITRWNNMCRTRGDLQRDYARQTPPRRLSRHRVCKTRLQIDSKAVKSKAIILSSQPSYQEERGGFTLHWISIWAQEVADCQVDAK